MCECKVLSLCHFPCIQTGVDFSSGQLNRSLELYTESELYHVAGMVCRVVAASKQSERLLHLPRPLAMNEEQMTSLNALVTVGVKFQEIACAWVSLTLTMQI